MTDKFQKNIQHNLERTKKSILQDLTGKQEEICIGIDYDDFDIIEAPNTQKIESVLDHHFTNLDESIQNSISNISVCELIMNVISSFMDKLSTEPNAFSETRELDHLLFHV